MHKRPHFFEKEQFLELLYCNGEEAVDLEELSPKTGQLIREFLANDIMEQSERPLPPRQSWQRYTVHAGQCLEMVHWSITGKCNFRCRHCLVSAPNAHHPQLPLEDCKRIIHEIACCGVSLVDITGGEPLVRTDFEEIVRELSGYSIEMGTLFTNASLLTEGTLQMMLPMCESVRYNMYIGPEGRLAPCMGFSDTAIGPKYPSVLEEPLGKLTLEGYYFDVVNTRISDFLAKNPECAECEHLTRCCGGCMVQGITDDGDYLVPDPRICYFHKHVGEQAVREVADAAILAAGLPLKMKAEA